MDKPLLDIDMVAWRDKQARLRNDANYPDNQSEVDEAQHEAWVHNNDPTYLDHPEPGDYLGGQL